MPSPRDFQKRHLVVCHNPRALKAETIKFQGLPNTYVYMYSSISLQSWPESCLSFWVSSNVCWKIFVSRSSEGGDGSSVCCASQPRVFFFLGLRLLEVVIILQVVVFSLGICYLFVVSGLSSRLCSCAALDNHCCVGFSTWRLRSMYSATIDPLINNNKTTQTMFLRPDVLISSRPFVLTWLLLRIIGSVWATRRTTWDSPESQI